MIKSLNHGIFLVRLAAHFRIANIVKKITEKIVKILRICNPSMTLQVQTKHNLGMELEFPELERRVLLSRDGIIKKLFNTIWLGLLSINKICFYQILTFKKISNLAIF